MNTMCPVALPLVVAIATSMEAAAVLQGLGIAQPAPAPGHDMECLVAGRTLRFIVTGTGPINAAIAAGRVITHPVAGLVCLGVAGTYALAAAPLGTAVVATRETWPEYGLATKDGVEAFALGFPQWGDKHDIDPPPVWDSLHLEPKLSYRAMRLPYLVTSVPREANNPFVVAGASVTVAGVTATRERARELSGKHAALMENMEGFALALAARQAGIPFGEVRTISNIVGERASTAWNMPVALAALGRVAQLLFATSTLPERAGG